MVNPGVWAVERAEPFSSPTDGLPWQLVSCKSDGMSVHWSPKFALTESPLTQTGCLLKSNHFFFFILYLIDPGNFTQIRPQLLGLSCLDIHTDTSTMMIAKSSPLSGIKKFPLLFFALQHEPRYLLWQFYQPYSCALSKQLTSSKHDYNICECRLWYKTTILLPRNNTPQNAEYAVDCLSVRRSILTVCILFAVAQVQIENVSSGQVTNSRFQS